MLAKVPLPSISISAAAGITGKQLTLKCLKPLVATSVVVQGAHLAKHCDSINGLVL